MLICATLFVAGCTEKNDVETSDDWVDLGLPSGLLWATRNVGATAPEDYGDYFAWGETSPKSVYSWSTYRYAMVDGDGNLSTLTKYNTGSYWGVVDNLTILQPDDDAATANWGGGARTPTKAEWEELISYTITKWTTRNGVSGSLLTGSNGNSIFLPAAGSRWDSSLYRAGSHSDYWSSSLDTDYPYYAWFFNINSEYQDLGGSWRYFGLSVRAVRSAR